MADEELAGRVLVQRLAGGETLDEICYSRQIPPSLVAQWLSGNVELAEACEVAGRLYVDGEVKRALRILDGKEWKDEMPGEGAAGARDRAEFRKWLAERLNKKRYGERVEPKYVGVMPSLQVTIVSGDAVGVVLENAVAPARLEEL